MSRRIVQPAPALTAAQRHALTHCPACEQPHAADRAKCYVDYAERFPGSPGFLEPVLCANCLAAKRSASFAETAARVHGRAS